MSYTIICEGKHTCSDYEKCTKQYKKTGIDKCIKKQAFQTYSCNGDNCKECTNLQQCDLILPTINSLKQDQQRISQIRYELTILEEDHKYLTNNPTAQIYNTNINEIIRTKDELTEELRTLRLKENRKLKLLRKRRLRRLK